MLIGSWGSADAADCRQWAVLEPLAPPDPPVWDEAARTCRNVTSGVEYRFLTSYAGQVRTLGCYTWRAANPFGPSDGTSVEQRISTNVLKWVNRFHVQKAVLFCCR